MARSKKRDGKKSTQDRRKDLIHDFKKKLPVMFSKASELNTAIESYRTLKGKRKEMSAAKYRNRMKDAGGNVRRGTDQPRAIALKLIEKMVIQNRKEFVDGMTNAKTRGQVMELIDNFGNNMPLYLAKKRPGSFVGGIEIKDHKPLNTGDVVAALNGDIWIMAMVVRENGGPRKFDVRDVDIDDAGERAEFTVSRKNIIPLPKYRANPDVHSHALFPKRALVLALYPQTTCFYKGVVFEPPKNTYDPYQIAFEDATLKSGYSDPFPVHQRYVITCKEVKDNTQKDHKKKRR